MFQWKTDQNIRRPVEIHRDAKQAEGYQERVEGAVQSDADR